ncbi:N-acetylmuramoyl-L-alanine amidase [Prosthecodimorpha staleyi]|uniref:N-acetylmuramoyl-L-alanine amidase n=1 Tax=Prosthecodimorpha staleyi TaxID=2840188 RepID=A0A947GHV6_9HYPH|nr:N-acetylmuramoyl-L-alanine amidase [Prosthecodimorpha staleyi]MBT9288109.1 N-acetylmuramoyl-L-alanine amidase [Prosthecodimorpha staleyi]
MCPPRRLAASLGALLLVAAEASAPAAALEPAPGPAGCRPEDLVVVLDVGHTPEQSGSASATGRREYDLNLALAETIAREAVAAGFTATQVMKTTGSGRSQLESRSRRAAEMGGGLFLSIHHDAVQDRYLKTWFANGAARRYSDLFAGHSLFVSELGARPAESFGFAMRLGDRLRAIGMRPTRHHNEPIPGENRPFLDEARGIHRYDELIVLKTAAMPAVLFEAGVIVNRAEERRIVRPEFRRCVARAVAAALADWCPGDKPPEPLACRMPTPDGGALTEPPDSDSGETE